MAQAKGKTNKGGQEMLEYLEIPLRRPWHVTIPFVLIVAAALAVSFILPKKYKSSTLILVESEKVPDAFVASMATERTSKRLQTIRQEILSRTRLERVISELQPYGPVGNRSLTATVETMRQAIDIAVKGNDAFSIDFVHRNPEMAMKVANRLATLFIEEATRAREEQVGEAYQFIETQLADARRELETREAALRRYKEQHMGTLPEQTPANLSTLQRLQMEQQSVGENLRTATERLIALESNPAKAAAAAGDTTLGQLQSQLATLRGRYTDEHPDVRALKARIAALEREQATRAPVVTDDPAVAARTQIELARAEVQKLKDRLSDIEAKITTFQSRVEQAPRTEQDIATLSRDFQKLNENYLTLLNKKLEAQMAAKLEQRWKGEQFRILDPANLPERHIFPNRKLFLAAGLFFGLLAGIATAFVADFLDHSVKNVREIEQLLPFPVLAVIPSFKDPRFTRYAFRRPSDPGADEDGDGELPMPRSL
jgi:polysaccharide chain length determinant protein (PEP-CTERM system associated)